MKLFTNNMKKFIKIYSTVFDSFSSLERSSIDLEKLINEEIEKGSTPIKIFSTQSTSGSGQTTYNRTIVLYESNNIKEFINEK